MFEPLPFHLLMRRHQERMAMEEKRPRPVFFMNEAGAGNFRQRWLTNRPFGYEIVIPRPIIVAPLPPEPAPAVNLQAARVAFYHSLYLRMIKPPL